MNTILRMQSVNSHLCVDSYVGNPSSLQATFASLSSNPSSQTVPHDPRPFNFTSNRPSVSSEPSTNRMLLDLLTVK